MKRSIIIVLDSVGMGEMPDSRMYGDIGANTLGNISKKVNGLDLPNLQKLGLGNIDNIEGYAKSKSPQGSFGRMNELSIGKDTTTGHWEMTGIILENPFPTYLNGFPNEVIEAFEKAIGTKILGNIPASGTEIIEKFGNEHVKTGYPIVYTSADSVFQIAAHEDVINIDKLYEMCEIARKILIGEHTVGRVIARPFVGQTGAYKRTDKRRDFAVDPIKETILDKLKNKGLKVKAVGKIEDIFNKKGITDAVHTHDNMDGVDKTIDYMKEDFEGLLFTNLVDFDMQFGHRRDVEGYAKALKEFDDRLPEIIFNMKNDDLLIITADHGCDPTAKGCDHTREYVPLLVYGKNFKEGINLHTRNGFNDIAETIADYHQINATFKGNSFLKDISK